MLESIWKIMSGGEGRIMVHIISITTFQRRTTIYSVRVKHDIMCISYFIEYWSGKVKIKDLMLPLSCIISVVGDQTQPTTPCLWIMYGDYMTSYGETVDNYNIDFRLSNALETFNSLRSVNIYATVNWSPLHQCNGLSYVRCQSIA